MMNISPHRLVVSLMVIVLTLGMGCASSAAIPAKAPTTTGAAGPGTVASGAAKAIPERKTIPVGVSVGERAPDFAILLADGTTVTSEELALQGKPAFLMFFATW